MTISVNPLIFRQYDIRGDVGTDLSEDFAFLLGRAYAGMAKEASLNNIAVGYDCRLSSPGYARALAEGIAAEGLDSQITGMGPTPQLYYALFGRSCGGGIQVTGSHNPPHMNGFKLCLGKRTLSSDDIQDLYHRMKLLPQRTRERDNSWGTVTDNPIQSEYEQMLIEKSQPYMGKRKLTIVCDAGNGVGGIVGPAVLRSLGHEVIELYCEPDGNFPNHHPDPSEPHNLETLIKTVRKNKADFGIGWDGDADRIGVVDDQGQIIFGDMLLLLYAREVLKERPGATIIGDVKCSKVLFDDLKDKGANVIMWKTGHSLVKAKLKETNAELAGEMSGHIFFNDRYFGYDDALYAACRFAELVSNTSMPVSSMLADLPTSFSTPELRVDCPEGIKFKIPGLIKEAFKEYNVDTTDGARITFANGWGLVRASNTQPVLVTRFEAQTQADLDKYRNVVQSKLEEIKNALNNDNV
jgi:phosphomannomutase/phosphoglucomutase